MNRQTAFHFLIVLLTGAILISGCSGGTSSGNTGADSSSSVKGPAPDNNSANNPSSADTNYQKDTGRKIRDSLRH